MANAKSIVITGASSGIGAALTKTFAQDGHRLFICARRTDRLAQLAQENPAVWYDTCDVTSEPEVRRFFERVGQQTPAIDVLIHCAAVMGPVGSITEIDSEEWFSAIKTDLFGAFVVIKHAIPLMNAAHRPRVLLLSGGGAFDPMPNLSAYGVSKAAIIRLAETLAVELAPHNIAVNVFAPGFVATEIFDSMLKVGPERGGPIYQTVLKLLSGWHDSDIEIPLECARFLIADESAPLTGKTVSARFDPWEEPEYRESFQEIMNSRLYATQRTNHEHLKGQPFADRLAKAAENQMRRRAKPDDVK